MVLITEIHFWHDSSGFEKDKVFKKPTSLSKEVFGKLVTIDELSDPSFTPKSSPKCLWILTLILTSSTIDKKLEIYKNLEIKLEIDKNLENKLKRGC